MSRPVAVILLVICTMLWGLAFIAQKTAMLHMGPLTFTGTRFLLGVLVLAPFAYLEFRRLRPSISRSQWLRIGAVNIAFFLGSWLQQVALTTATVTNAGFLTALYVIMVPIMRFAVLRVRPHPIVYVGAPMALIGIYFLTGARFDAFTVGDAELVFCAFFWAIQIAMLGPLVRETGMPIGISVLTFVFTAVVALAIAILVEHPVAVQLASGWIEILYAGIFSTAIAFTLQAVGQQYVPPANAAIILSGESLFAALGGAVLLHERLPPIGYAGAAMIFVAIILVELVPALRSRRSLTSSPG